MKKWFAVALVLLVSVVWWLAAAPRPEIRSGESVVIDSSTQRAIAAVDDSAGFAAGLEHFPSSLPHFDDVVFLEGEPPRWSRRSTGRSGPSISPRTSPRPWWIHH